ncbi:MAG: CTP-dependent riboflavin kinase [Thaumarchaeota archaeon]|nr:CTP-dependent riboflavin kinase [Nitrososphaerota archaeon]
MRSALLPTLLELNRLGARTRFATVSSAHIGAELGLSQQAISNHLVALEREGLIERRRVGKKVGTRLTRKGTEEVVRVYSSLKFSFENDSDYIDFSGRLFTGLKEGAFYIGLPGYRRQFRRLLGFDPFPGTFNLKLVSQSEVDKKGELRLRKGLSILGFEDAKRSYGPASCFRAKIAGKFDGAALVIERTHHDDSVLELIAPNNLREKLNASDGSKVGVRVYFG